MTLDQIEHDTIRAQFKEPRIHAAVNCASASCPPLQPRAFLPSKLEGQLEAAMRAFINDPARNRVDQDGVRLSRIFDWFARDFEAAGGVRAYVGRHLSPAARAHLDAATEIGFLEYDWALNGAR
jgi:hypothetical protein